ncbi:hypothetical protein CF15_04430 [Pyrodictium occultum]|uniref:Formate dehydrogenase family accessory protein FdhD n=1 Tax=Pyrodictium occultum TaxID=2309 RepID=A0A0V8RVE8_PYROC|nr:formate dehydrogenase accessory sulfurtransferase FdhD [Pyrodictium occultum]KSW12031.1 hypothetical protein CF15_04430 [Pyrodictium occultum]
MEERVARAVDAARECSLATTMVSGLRVAADYEYVVELDGRRLGSIYTSPNYLADAVAGLALREELAELGDHVELLSVTGTGDMSFLVRARLARAAAAGLPEDRRVEWSLVEEAYRDLVHMVPKHRCPYALHSVAVYGVERGSGSAERLLLVSDVSRHSAMLKAAGMLSRLAAAGRLRGLALVAVSTGRVSGDAVKALARAGVRVIVANHHPLLSGLAAARKHGVTLVLRRPDGRGLAVYTAPERIQGAPLVMPLGRLGLEPYAEASPLSPLC